MNKVKNFADFLHYFTYLELVVMCVVHNKVGVNKRKGVVRIYSVNNNILFEIKKGIKGVIGKRFKGAKFKTKILI